MWHFLAFHYCVGHCIRVFGDRSVGGSLIGVMHAPLHVPVVLLCSAYRACSCSLLKAPHPHPPLCYYIFYIVLLSRFSTVLPVQCGEGWDRVFLADGARGWIASRAGSWPCSGCFSLRSASSSPIPTSICEED